VPNTSTSDRTTWLLAALLALSTLLLYVPTLHNGFIQFDDPAYVTENSHVRAGLTFHGIAWAFTSLDESNWHPLAWISHLTDVQLYGLTPAGHHFTSILIHALNAAFLFLILYRGTGCRWRSLFVAALFALHPMNVENVAWVAERKSLLCMFFSLATVACYARYVRAPNRRRYFLLILAFALALMSKPMAVTLPVLLLLLDFWPLDRIHLHDSAQTFSAQAAHLFVEKIPLFVMSVGSSIVTIVAQHRGGAVSDFQHLPFSERFSNAIVATVTYARRTIWPNDLSYFYPHPGATLSRAAFWLSLAILITITALVFPFRRHRYFAFGWMFFLISLLPVIGLLQVGMQSMADRYAYLPTIGLFIAIVWGLGDIVARFRIPSPVPAVLAIASLAGFATCTFVTEHYWFDSLTLFTRAQQVSHIPNSYIETNLAAALLDHHRDREALEHFREAAKLAPNDFIPHYNLGYLLAQQHDFAAAASEYEEALRCTRQPANRARVLYSLGIAYLNLGDRRKAADAFKMLLELDPGNSQARQLLDDLQRDSPAPNSRPASK
jgi:protein O-mannosyl-transferase